MSEKIKTRLDFSAWVFHKLLLCFQNSPYLCGLKTFDLSVYKLKTLFFKFLRRGVHGAFDFRDGLPSHNATLSYVQMLGNM